MHVNFKGFKNIGTLGPAKSTGAKDVLNIFNMQLTDDYNGNDLSEYKKVISNHPELINTVNPYFMNLISFNFNGKEGLFLNGKKLPLNDDNLDVYSFVVKAFKKIAMQKTDKFVVNRDYLTSDDFYNGFTQFFDIKFDNLPRDKYAQIVNILHDPSIVKESAKSLYNELQNSVIKYFE